MKPELNQKQRILVATIYLLFLALIFNFIGGNFKNIVLELGVDSSVWFYSGALLIILGAYIAEPYFSKPSDTIPNSIAVIIALLGLNEKANLIGFHFILYYSVTMLFISILSIASKESSKSGWLKVSKISYWIAVNLGHNKVIFSTLYISAAITYFGMKGEILAFILMLTLWICLIFFDIIGYIIIFINKIPRLITQHPQEIGVAIGCENPFLYKVEIDYSIHKRKPLKIGDLVAVETKLNSGNIGIIVSKSQLLNKEWLSIYLLKDSSNSFISISLKLKKQFIDPKSIFTKLNIVYIMKLSEMSHDNKVLIESNTLYKNREKFIGYVERDSTINKINFSILSDYSNLSKKVSEGSVLEIPIYNELTLYQVINGNTIKEHLENHDSRGLTIGIARKLGKYNNQEKELETRKWLPEIYSPVYLIEATELSEEQLKEIAKSSSIGTLPNSSLQIPIKDINSLITHNTAILGILGIGKSCLSYEIISKVIGQDIKVICIDITNEYKKELPHYLDPNLIVSDEPNAFNEINSKYDYIHVEGSTKNYEKSGNLPEYRAALKKDIKQFLFNQDTTPESKEFNWSNKIRIFNPDYHKCSKGEKVGFNVITTDLSQVEKTRIIAEELFKILMELPLTDEKSAKVMLVFEEAHSLVPEWNSASNDGDKTATNGTAKVILQGRKYGLGSLIITQRTANVSKSILNQCNTIFALRVFDDTGKAFLENYFGSDYIEVLPTLEERCAVVIGRGLKLKQPVIIQLNDRKHITDYDN